MVQPKGISQPAGTMATGITATGTMAITPVTITPVTTTPVTIKGLPVLTGSDMLRCD
jgi:hypothetical protein